MHSTYPFPHEVTIFFSRVTPIEFKPYNVYVLPTYWAPEQYVANVECVTSLTFHILGFVIRIVLFVLKI